MLLKDQILAQDGDSLLLTSSVREQLRDAQVLEVTDAVSYLQRETPSEQKGAFHFGVFPNVLPTFDDPLFLEGQDQVDPNMGRYGWLVTPYEPTPTRRQYFYGSGSNIDFSITERFISILPFAEVYNETRLVPVHWWFPVSSEGLVMMGDVENEVPVMGVPGYDQHGLRDNAHTFQETMYIPLFVLCCLHAQNLGWVRTIDHRRRKTSSGATKTYKKLFIENLKAHLDTDGDIQTVKLSHSMIAHRSAFEARW